MLKTGLAALSLLLSAQAFAYTSSYAQMNLRGTFNGWGNTPMQLTADNTWSTTVTLAAGATLKFDVKGDWTVNFGDDNKDEIAERSGANISVPIAGDYTIRFNDSTRRYDLLVKKMFLFNPAGSQFSHWALPGLPLAIYRGNAVYNSGAIVYDRNYGMVYRADLPVNAELKLVVDASKADAATKTGNNLYQSELQFKPATYPLYINAPVYACGSAELGVQHAPRDYAMTSPFPMTCKQGVWYGSHDLNPRNSGEPPRVFSFHAGSPGQHIWGDYNKDGILGYNEPAISVAKGGAYDFVVNLNTGAYTATLRAPKTVEVTLTCKNASADRGQFIYATGNLAQLGSWAPSKGVSLSHPGTSSWSGKVALPANTAVEWKCAKVSTMPTTTTTWQPGSNNKFVTPASGSMSVSASF